MPTLNGDLESCDDDDVELLEVRHKPGTTDDFNPPATSQIQATRSPKGRYWESLHRLHPKILPKNNTNKADSIVEVTEEGYVELPSLHQLPLERGPTPEPETNIDRPYYNNWAHCKGVVAWWDNRTGKGMIVDHRCNLEHKIELKDIKYSNYGALVPGSMVEYEYFDHGMNKGFSKFWVVSGCDYVL